MAASFFDQRFHQFRCENPECRETFEKTIRSLLKPKKVFCPECGTAIDISESKSSGETGLDIDLCYQLDKKLRQKNNSSAARLPPRSTEPRHVMLSIPTQQRAALIG